jgi:EmrB/QacA subfamily drug resistance transporter
MDRLRRAEKSVDIVSEPLNKTDIRLIMVGLGLAMLLSALDQTIVATAMPTIGQAFADFAHLPWIVTAYLVASTAVTPLYGKLADIHGAGLMLLGGIVIFVIGSIACALAPNMELLALARGVQGLGGGGLIALAQTVIADLVRPRERARLQSYFSLVFVTSSLGGPLLGGFFSERLHWSLIFWINVPLGLAAFVMAHAKLAALPQRRHPHRLDFAGAILLVLASSAFLLALSWGGVRYGWGSAPIVALLAASFALSALFAWRTKTAEEPLIPLAVLSNAIVRNAIVSGGFGLGAFIALTIYMPIYFEGALGLSADRSGVALIPLMVGTVTGATVSGRLMARLRHYKAPPLIALAGAFAAAVTLSLRLGDLSLAALDVLLCAMSFGIGAMLPVTTVSVQNAVHSHDVGTATAVMQFSRQLGGALIVAAFGAIIIGGHAEFAQDPSFASAPLSAESIDALRETFRTAFAAAALAILLSFLFLARMEEKPLHGEM